MKLDTSPSKKVTSKFESSHSSKKKNKTSKLAEIFKNMKSSK